MLLIFRITLLNIPLNVKIKLHTRMVYVLMAIPILYWQFKLYTCILLQNTRKVCQLDNLTILWSKSYKIQGKKVLYYKPPNHPRLIWWEGCEKVLTLTDT